MDDLLLIFSFCIMTSCFLREQSGFGYGLAHAPRDVTTYICLSQNHMIKHHIRQGIWLPASIAMVMRGEKVEQKECCKYIPIFVTPPTLYRGSRQ